MERVLPAQHQVERPMTETGSLASGASRRRPQQMRARNADASRTHLHVIGADIFRGALIRERKIADRTNHRFGVLLVGIEERSATAASVWDSAIDAVANTKRETDVFGWFEQGATLGIILPDIGGTDGASVDELEGRVTRELLKRLGPEIANRFSVKLHLHQDHRQNAAAARPVEPLISALQPAKRTTGYDRLKRALDLTVSLSLLAAFSPVFLVVAALIKLTSRGPVFFRQQRVGQHTRPFMMLKFRTMQANNSSAVHQQYVSQFINGGGDENQATKPGIFKIANDTRITSVGRFLRRTSIDELPQLWNVVRGEMSLVGPRPPLPYEVEQYKAWHRRRVLEAKPGMTGLWQVAGRSRTTFDEMVRLDLRYARSCSFWTDLKILLATPRAVIGGKGAC